MKKVKEGFSELTQGVDYTIDALGRFVFTRDYHLKRGYCCENGCVHCPYTRNAFQDINIKTPSIKD